MPSDQLRRRDAPVLPDLNLNSHLSDDVRHSCQGGKTTGDNLVNTTSDCGASGVDDTCARAFPMRAKYNAATAAANPPVRICLIVISPSGEGQRCLLGAVSLSLSHHP